MALGVVPGGDERTAGVALLGIAIEHFDAGRLDEAAEVLERVLEIGHHVPDAILVTDALLLSGNVARERADFERARACLEEAGTVAGKAGYATSGGSSCTTSACSSARWAIHDGPSAC